MPKGQPKERVVLPLETQAERIVRKFGGVRALAEALKAVGHPMNHSTIYRWNYPRDNYGTGGLIPTPVWPHILAAARHEGLFLTADDFDVALRKPKLTLREHDEWGK